MSSDVQGRSRFRRVAPAGAEGGGEVGEEGCRKVGAREMTPINGGRPDELTGKATGFTPSA